MSAKQKALPASFAFTKGADLWVVSTPVHSQWNPAIDWYLYFQLKNNRTTRVQRLNTKRLTPYVKDVAPIKKLKWSSPNPLPVLVKSSSYLPNCWVLELDYHPEWVLKVYQIWALLNKPSIRFFVPKFLVVSSFIQEWAKQTKMDFLSYQYVEEF